MRARSPTQGSRAPGRAAAKANNVPLGTESDARAASSYPAILVAEFLAILGFAASGPLLPSFLGELGIEGGAPIKLWSGLVSSLPSAMLALFAPVWGALADRYGRKPMLLRAMFGGSAIVFLISLSREPWHLLVLRSVQGCFTGTVAAATVLVASTSPGDRLGVRLGLLQTAVFTGNSAGPAFGGLVAEAFGNRASFLLTSLLLLCGALVVLFLVKENFRRAEQDAPRGGAEAARPGLARLKPPAALIPLLAVVLMYQLAGSNLVPILPLYVKELAHDPERVRSISGLIIGVASLTGALAAALTGRLSSRFGHARVLMACLGMAAFCHFFQAFARSAWDVFLWRAVEGAFLGGTMPSVNALIALRTAPGRQGASFGFSTSVGQLGGSLGPMMGASVAALAGYRPVFGLTGGLLFLTALGVGLFDRLRGKETKAAGP